MLRRLQTPGGHWQRCVCSDSRQRHGPSWIFGFGLGRPSCTVPPSIQCRHSRAPYPNPPSVPPHPLARPQELSTILRYGTNPIIFIMNNGGWRAQKQRMEPAGVGPPGKVRSSCDKLSCCAAARCAQQLAAGRQGCAGWRSVGHMWPQTGFGCARHCTFARRPTCSAQRMLACSAGAYTIEIEIHDGGLLLLLVCSPAFSSHVPLTGGLGARMCVCLNCWHTVAQQEARHNAC